MTLHPAKEAPDPGSRRAVVLVASARSRAPEGEPDGGRLRGSRGGPRREASREPPSRDALRGPSGVPTFGAWGQPFARALRAGKTSSVDLGVAATGPAKGDTRAMGITPLSGAMEPSGGMEAGRGSPNWT